MTVKEFEEISKEIKTKGQHIIRTFFTDRYEYEGKTFTSTDDGYTKYITDGDRRYSMRLFYDKGSLTAEIVEEQI